MLHWRSCQCNSPETAKHYHYLCRRPGVRRSFLLQWKFDFLYAKPGQNGAARSEIHRFPQSLYHLLTLPLRTFFRTTDLPFNRRRRTGLGRTRRPELFKTRHADDRSNASEARIPHRRIREMACGTYLVR